MARRLEVYEGGRAGASSPGTGGERRAAPRESVEADGRPPPGEGVPEPTPLSPDEVVPLFRGDLRVDAGASPALVEVGDPVGGKRFQLYDFELVIARMLDGRRRVSDVIENARRLGIPVDVHGLFVFVRQLWHYGFLAPVGTESGAESAGWPAHEKWNEATGTLFQSGLRMMRLGRPGDAAGYFEAVLDADPGNSEARRLLALVEEERSGAAARSGPPRPAIPPPEGPPAAPVERGPPGLRAPARRGAVRVAGVAAVAALALGLAAAGVLVWTRRAGAPPSGPASGVADRAAAAAEVPVSPERSPDRTEPPSPSSAPVDRRWHPPLAAVLAPADGVVAWEREPDAVVARGERIGSVRAARASPDPAARRRLAELEALAARDPIYREFLEKERRRQRSLARRSAGSTGLFAPEGGLLVLEVGSSSRARAGAVLGHVADRSVWHLSARLKGDAPGTGASCRVVRDTGAESAGCRVLEARPAPGGTELVVALAAGDAPWLERARSPQVQLVTAGRTAWEAPERAGGGSP